MIQPDLHTTQDVKFPQYIAYSNDALSVFLHSFIGANVIQILNERQCAQQISKILSLEI